MNFSNFFGLALCVIYVTDRKKIAKNGCAFHEKLNLVQKLVASDRVSKSFVVVADFYRYASEKYRPGVIDIDTGKGMPKAAEHKMLNFRSEHKFLAFASRVSHFPGF